jgi:hypothetical protein
MLTVSADIAIHCLSGGLSLHTLVDRLDIFRFSARNLHGNADDGRAGGCPLHASDQATWWLARASAATSPIDTELPDGHCRRIDLRHLHSR